MFQHPRPMLRTFLLDMQALFEKQSHPEEGLCPRLTVGGLSTCNPELVRIYISPITPCVLSLQETRKTRVLVNDQRVSFACNRYGRKRYLDLKKKEEEKQ